jgi:3-dehydroquinate dehydratase I
MKTKTVRGVEIGSGKPKIIVPITGRTEEEITNAAKAVAEADIDAAEWRVDFYEEAGNSASVLTVLKNVREVLGNKILLFTMRTAREGGEAKITEPDYAVLLIAAAKSGYADIIDVEASSGAVMEIIEAVHENRCLVLASFHDFDSTPSKERIVSYLKTMQDIGADITKIAVMPKSEKDVLTLLEASVEFKKRYADRPFIAISMGALGAVSRIACEFSGSAMTFGVIDKLSAPGQLPADELARVINMLHSSR